MDTIKPTVTSIETKTKEVNTAIDSITIEATDNSGQAVTKVSTYQMVSHLMVRQIRLVARRRKWAVTQLR